ncbi:MAG: hypothetical protein NTV07_00520 [Candidatus Omnitrophica bacterium]|nr:hypothetical protein [Candidatus Omnitrophota bacterium]
MIKINLIPDELKKTQAAKQPFKFELDKLSLLGPKVMKIGVYCLIVLAGLHVILILAIFLKADSLKGLDSKWVLLEPKKAEVEAVNAEIVSVEKVVQPVNNLMGQRQLWSKNLNQLSNLMTPGIWLTTLSLEPHMLRLEGCASSLYGDETGLVGKFIKALQDDREFSAQFSEIKLGPMERGALDKTPIMNFKIFCIMRKG